MATNNYFTPGFSPLAMTEEERMRQRIAALRGLGVTIPGVTPGSTSPYVQPGAQLTPPDNLLTASDLAQLQDIEDARIPGMSDIMAVQTPTFGTALAKTLAAYYTGKGGREKRRKYLLLQL